MLFYIILADEDDGLAQPRGHREHATALVMACRHLPSQLTSADQRATMLADAAKSYEKLGDKKALQDCRNLMMRFSNSGLTANPVPVC